VYVLILAFVPVPVLVVSSAYNNTVEPVKLTVVAPTIYEADTAYDAVFANDAVPDKDPVNP